MLNPGPDGSRGHAYLPLAPHFVDGGLAPPLVRAVDDVVVDQAGRVDHL